jgi:squalene-associated FAD-dependent desaturase
MAQLAQDHAVCREVLTASHSSFALPIRLLPPAKRQAMTALYAFCRCADDIADGPADSAGGGPPAQAPHARVELAAFRDGLSAALAGEPCDEPVLRAVADVAARYAVPSRFLFAVLEGVTQDLDFEQRQVADPCLFEGFDQLQAYCRRVASAVGLASIHIWGFSGAEALPAADACGLAFQLTNILRDITEDLARGRVYLPREDLNACGCTVADLAAAAAGEPVTPGLQRLLRLLLTRTKQLYAEAAELDCFLSRDGKRIFRAMFGIYRGIFAQVTQTGAGVFQSRPRPSRSSLAWSFATTLACGPRRDRTAAALLPPTINPKHDPDGAPLPIVIVGGGLAGLAAAAALVEAGVVNQGTPVRILESRRHVGGRAASFEDREAGGLVDACQHVAMGCCTNFLDLCQRVGIGEHLRHDRELWFLGPDGRRAGCTPSRWLPAPLHLAPLLGAMPHFSIWEKLALARGMVQLVRWRPGASGPNEAAAWLEHSGQPARVIELFWQPVLESALGDTVQRVSVEASRKVMLDGFLSHQQAADLYVPRKPLGTLFGGGLAEWLQSRGVVIDRGLMVEGVDYAEDGRVAGVRIERRGRSEIAAAASQGDGESVIACRACIMAVPWRMAGRLVPAVVPEGGEGLEGSPITAVHLWFDRQVIDLPHAVLLGRLSQWVFRPDEQQGSRDGGYCQVVISGSHDLLRGDRKQLLEKVVQELRELFPAAEAATLLDSRIVTDPTAVLSVRPGVDALRPASATSVANLFLAGDWTATGWPSTMEGAVRSGRLAAAACLSACGSPQAVLAPDLPRGRLVRWLTIGRA